MHWSDPVVIVLVILGILLFFLFDAILKQLQASERERYARHQEMLTHLERLSGELRDIWIAVGDVSQNTNSRTIDWD